MSVDPSPSRCHGVTSNQEAFDITHLERDHERKKFLKKCLATRLVRACEDGSRAGFVSAALEGSDRFIFVFSFVYIWLLFLDKHRGFVQHRHEVAVIAFIMNKINGALLGVDVMEKLLDLNELEAKA